MRALRTSRYALVIASRATRSRDIRLAGAVVAVERLAVVVPGRGNANPTCNLTGSFNIVAHEAAVTEIKPTVAERRHGQNAVGTRELRGSLQQDVISMVTAIGVLARAALGNESTKAGRHNVEVLQTGIDKRLVRPQEQPTPRAVQHF